jgi:pyruvate-formate lyase
MEADVLAEQIRDAGQLRDTDQVRDTEQVRGTDQVRDTEQVRDPWRTFQGRRWQDTIDVAAFVQNNYTPYTGDSGFLAGPTDRTLAIWDRLREMFVEERRRGIYDVDAATPSTITAHAPGYIDKERELIVGLQTDAPLRRRRPAGAPDLLQLPQDAQRRRVRRLP